MCESRKRSEISDWDDLRYVLAVARNGTVSEKTPAHHATVIRRIDRLEKKFPAKLFDRRKTGYVLTSTGHYVKASAEAIETIIISDQSFIGRSKSQLSRTARIGAPDGFGSYCLVPRLIEIANPRLKGGTLPPIFRSCGRPSVNGRPAKQRHAQKQSGS
jgi:DNA-binding transcriptional LysR family regulator